MGFSWEKYVFWLVIHVFFKFYFVPYVRLEESMNKKYVERLKNTYLFVLVQLCLVHVGFIVQNERREMQITNFLLYLVERE